MKIIKAKKILNFENGFKVLQNKAIAFDKTIIQIDDFEKLKNKYKNAIIIDCSNDIIAPCFINTHTHLEFSSNKTSFVYGDFLKWVESIVKSRDNLSKEANNKLIEKTIKSIMKSGVCTIGEISSFGIDLEICANSQARIVFFNEILGANDKICSENWDKFINRFNASLKYKNDKFIPAISVHSPYSTHPKLTKKACEFAKKNSLLMSVHFLESNHEKNWLTKGSGGFKKWLLNFNKNPEPMYNIDSFLKYFKDIKTLFTHCVYVDDFSKFDKKMHSITHCAFSNRLLSKKTLNLKKLILSEIKPNIGTDGLSSNISLNFFDELRANLLIHDDFDLHKLAEILWISSTINAANALNLNSGLLSVGRLADIAVYENLECEDSELLLQLILQTKEVKKLFVGGDECSF
ncbi:metal-dependent hydrolase [Campylobacter sp. RM12327]|uniref:aminofutalosine deaminase family hydrolase n=1 Tax=Campylobacter sputorum TaxID=206 RepID=UPI000B795CFB|nr:MULTISPECIES: metal-dependent hydrolase [Campylobacter]ASM40030.1 metallo-dependent hydrolase, subgroup D [Campylobacter sputorum]MBE7358213.1 metal-dependent hydrolase [Campylobacter sp. RM11302]MBF6670075.1 metal-dependent hydrolase [Campylobacter sp. RM12327]MBF6674472.1 metal-dependent hydrolase [Campylobacter sp. RM13538]MBF6676487.1 metal-dependent hydrolase [Campylobacter sp. RM12321]